MLDKFKKRLTLIVTIPLLFTACEIFEPYDERTYYNVTGEGYVYYYDTKEPAKDAQVVVFHTFESRGYATVQPIREYYTTDSMGYFCVSFMKRTSRSNVFSYDISAHEKTNILTHITAYSDYIMANDLKNKKGSIKIDTLWLNKE